MEKQVTVETHVVRKSADRKVIIRMLELGFELAARVDPELAQSWADARDEYLPVLEGK